MGDKEISEINVKLARIEEKLAALLDQRKEERDETKNHRKACAERLDDIETYIEGRKEADKAKSESALSKSALASLTDIARTVIMVITVMIAMKILHF